MIEIKYTGDAFWERIERAVEKVKDRMRRVTDALNKANVPYAIIGGNAVQHWVSQVDESAVRNTQDVDFAKGPNVNCGHQRHRKSSFGRIRLDWNQLLMVNLSTFLACLFVVLGYIAIDSFFLPGFRWR